MKGRSNQNTFRDINRRRIRAPDTIRPSPDQSVQFSSNGFVGNPVDLRSRANPRVVRRGILRGRGRIPLGKPLTLDDSMWNLVGIGGDRPGEKTDVASDKYACLAEMDHLSRG